MIERIEKINSLIKLISEQECRFFLNKSGTGLIANFQLREGRLYYQDEWKGELGEITLKTDWVKIGDWVSHGSGIRQQIIAFANFILNGIPPGKMLSRYWGISFEAQVIIHKKGHEIGYLDGDRGFEFHDYHEHKDRYCCDECGINEAFARCEKGMRLCSKCESVHYHYTGHRTEQIPGIIPILNAMNVIASTAEVATKVLDTTEAGMNKLEKLKNKEINRINRLR